MALIYNATFDKNTRELSFEDKAGNEIYSFTVPERGPVDDITKPLTFKATQDGSTVKLTRYGNSDSDFQTSTDGGDTWTDYTIDDVITLNIGDEVSFRVKTRRTAQSYSGYVYFIMTGKIEAWHNVMSMHRTSDFATYDTADQYSFYQMFYGCTSLTKAPVLPATTLDDRCYTGMFRNCTSLVEAPELRATKLVTISDVKASEFYQSMFSGCTSLKKAPALPLSSLGIGSYSWMFAGCTSLIEAPELRANTEQECYKYMFSGCTSLVKAPKLSLSNKYASEPFVGMFLNCSSLNEVRCTVYTRYFPKPSDISYNTSDWLKGVSATGTFYTNADAKWPSGTSGIPENWTRVKI